MKGSKVTNGMTIRNTECAGLRVLLVGPYPPPFGGIASHLTTLVPGLYSRGAADVAVLSTTDGDDKDEIVDGVTVYRRNLMRNVGRAALPTNWLVVLATLRELGRMNLGYRSLTGAIIQAILVNSIARIHNSDVVSFYQVDRSFGMLPCALLWGKKRGIVLTVFGESYNRYDYFSERQELVRRMIDRPHSVVASSKHCARGFRDVGSNRDIEAVYYGIDSDRFSAADLRDKFRAQLGLMTDELLLTYMGRFNAEMGVGRLLEVGDELLARVPNAKMLLAGAKGPLAEAAAAFSSRHPGRVIIRHDVPFSLQPEIYAATDVSLAPSADRHACMGMSIKEAMAASRPVIGSISGGVPEAIVDGETGLLVPLDDSNHIDRRGLLEAVERLAGDVDLRSRMGKAARMRVENIFTMDRTIDRMAQIFMAARPKK